MEGIDRRNFLKGAALSMGAAMTLGVVGCSPAAPKTGNASAEPAQSASEEQVQASSKEPVQAAAEPAAPKSWRDVPAAIADIAETVEADVVVVGAGASGSVATLAAAAGGAKTICIQKGDMVLSHGRNYGAINSRFQKEAERPETDIMEIASAHIRYNGGRPKMNFVLRIFEESAQTLEWLHDETGVEYTLIKRAPQNEYGWDNPVFETGHLTPADMMAIGFSKVILDKAVSDYSAELVFNSPGEQLVVDGSGKVTGVIANQNGKYVQFNAKKGVILATGDYGSDYEMCADLCPWVVGTHNYYNPNYNTGDGHKMGVWVGAQMETAPHTKMAHVHNCIDGTDLSDAPIKKDPFLWVNQNGKRFMNEEMKYWIICNTICEQPDDVYYIVFDSNYNTFLETMWNPGKAIDPAALDAAVEKGYASVGDTLEEAAKKFDIPADALKATVERYNELCAGGVDLDFGKPAADMQPVEAGPFYIVRCYTPMDVTMGGLMTDLDMQVVDESGKVIEGLYAVGNTSGGFYGGTDYDLECDAFSLGRAATTGRLAGQHAAAK